MTSFQVLNPWFRTLKFASPSISWVGKRVEVTVDHAVAGLLAEAEGNRACNVRPWRRRRMTALTTCPELVKYPVRKNPKEDPPPGIVGV